MGSVLRSTTTASILALLGALGCSSSTQNGPVSEPVADDFSEVAGLIRDYSTEYQKGPSRIGDLAKNQPLYPRGYQAIKSGTVVVVWGIRMAQQGQGGGTSVIAYEKKAETAGGAVLLENGDVKHMTADEFKSAQKAR